MGMWVLFGKSFEQNLITGFELDRDTAKVVAAKAKLRYKEIIAGLPEFEKADRFKMNIVNSALPSAFVLNTQERPNVKRLRAADRNLCSWNMEFRPYPDGSGYEARFTA